MTLYKQRLEAADTYLVEKLDKHTETGHLKRIIGIASTALATLPVLAIGPSMISVALSGVVLIALWFQVAGLYNSESERRDLPAKELLEAEREVLRGLLDKENQRIVAEWSAGSEYVEEDDNFPIGFGYFYAEVKERTARLRPSNAEMYKKLATLVPPAERSGLLSRIRNCREPKMMIRMEDALSVAERGRPSPSCEFAETIWHEELLRMRERVEPAETRRHKGSASLAGSTQMPRDARVSFEGATFHGPVSFEGATFPSDTSFEGAMFHDDDARIGADAVQCYSKARDLESTSGAYPLPVDHAAEETIEDEKRSADAEVMKFIENVIMAEGVDPFTYSSRIDAAKAWGVFDNPGNLDASPGSIMHRIMGMGHRELHDGYWGRIRASRDVLGDATGTREGDIRGDVRGSVLGAVEGNIHGDVRGSVRGAVRGSIYGSVREDIIGTVAGNILGSVRGNVSGKVAGGIAGDVRGDITGVVKGNILGKVRGNVTGDVEGYILGGVDGKQGNAFKLKGAGAQEIM